MNGYEFARIWYNYKFENPNKVRAIHSDFYFYVVNLWNNLGQVDNIGLPTTMTMQALNIGSYNTYKNTLNDLIDFGFIKLISASTNQHQSKIVALSIFDEASDKATDRALSVAISKIDEANPSALSKTDKPTDTIIESIIDTDSIVKKDKVILSAFSSFWDLYAKKKDTSKCEKKWLSLSEKERSLAMSVVKKYVESTPDVKYRKNPLTWLNGQCWLDEIENNSRQSQLPYPQQAQPLPNNLWTPTED